MENIPNIIFELLAQKPFRQLSEQERVQVLPYIDALAYEELRSATLLGKAMQLNQDKWNSNAQQKAQLMERLKQKNQKGLWYNKQIPLWKVVALFLAFMGLLYLSFFMRKPVSSGSLLAQIDTVYIERNIPAEKIYDTLYLSIKTKDHSQSKTIIKQEEKLANRDSFPISVPSQMGLNTLSVADYNKSINSKTGKSIKDDSLVSTIGFVTL
jgi:hypothetical protein